MENDKPEKDNIDPKVLEVYQILRLYKDDSRRVKWKRDRKTAWDAIENEMYSEADKSDMREEGQIPLVINKLFKGVQGATAVATDQKPEVKFLPIGDGDLYIAELMKRGHDFVWEQNQETDLSYEIVEECKIGGVGIFYARFNPSRGTLGKIEVEELNPECTYWSPTAKKWDYSDSHLIIARPRTKRYLQERYKVTEEDLLYDLTLPTHMQKVSGVTGKDNYAEAMITGESETPGIPGPENHWEIEAWLLKSFVEDSIMTYDDDGNPVGKVPVPEDQIDPELMAKEMGGTFVRRVVERRIQRIIVGTKLVSERVNPYGVDAEGDPVIPVVVVKHTRTRSAFPRSPTMYALDLNREKNKRRAQFIYLVSQNASSPIIQPSGLTKWSKSPSKAGAIADVDANAGFQPFRLGAGTLDASRFIELENRADNDIDDMYDMPDVMRGRLPKGADKSGRLLLALQESGGTMHRPFMRKYESAIARLGKLVGVLLLRHWPRSLWERLVEKSELEDETIVDEKTGDSVGAKWVRALDLISPPSGYRSPVSILDFDIKVVPGSSMPTNRMAKSLMAVEFVNAGIYPPEAALEYIDDPNKDKIVAMIRANAQEKSMANALK